MKTKVAEISEIDEGKSLCVKAENVNLLLIKKDGQVFAMENKCPHLNLPMTKGKVVDGQIICPFHGSSFDLKTGENMDWVNSVGGMSLPKWSRGLVALGKKPQPVKTFSVEIDGNSVFVAL